MARETSEAASGRRLLVGALVLLGATTGAALGRLFRGEATTWRLLAAGAAAAAIAALLERRGLVVSMAGSAAGLAGAVTLLVFPHTTLFGLPTTGTVTAAVRAFGQVGRHAAEEITPAAPLASLVVASLVAIWCAITASHWLASRAASPVLSLLPPAALFAFADYLAEDGARLGYILAFLAASITVLLGSSMLRLESWGPVIAWSGKRGSLRGVAGQARGVGTAAVALALVAPWLLPGFGAEALLDLSGRGGRIVINPIVDIRPNLLRNPAVELFRVRARRPAYWRLVSLDFFDGRRWRTNDLTGRDGLVVAGGRQLASIPTDAEVLDQRFEISRLATPWLPAAFHPAAADLEGRRGRFDPSRSSLAIPGGAPEGIRYRVTSRLIAPTSDELSEASANADPTSFGEGRALPPGLPPRITAIAQELTADADTPYDKILAIQQHLRSFTYDERAPAGHGVNDILFFLERSKRGYCEQFAGTMAVLLRTLGYSARVAVGFLPGRRAADGAFVVTTKDAHAWTEVYFRGYGWLAFEPTPSRSNPVALDYTNPPAVVAGLPVTQGEVALTQDGGSSQRVAAERPPAPVGPEAPGGAGTRSGPPLWLLPIVALGALLLVGTGRALRRRARVARARTPAARALASYRAFASVADDVGLGRRTGETLSEHLRRMGASAGLDPAVLRGLGGPAERALYSAASLEPGEGDRARQAWRRGARELRRHVGLARAALGLYGLGQASAGRRR